MMYTRDEVREKVLEVVRDCVPEADFSSVSDSEVINTDTGIDSMGFTLIICRLEAIFDVRIPNRQWSKLQTMGDVVDAIYKRLPKS